MISLTAIRDPWLILRAQLPDEAADEVIALAAKYATDPQPTPETTNESEKP